MVELRKKLPNVSRKSSGIKPQGLKIATMLGQDIHARPNPALSQMMYS